MTNRVEVYYNLHKQCLSFRPIGGKVEHARQVVLKGVTFAVQPAGQAKVRREKRKTVHAFVRGTMMYSVSDQDKLSVTEPMSLDDEWFPVTYNPYTHDSFMVHTGSSSEPIYSAPAAVLIDKKVWVRLPF